MYYLFKIANDRISDEKIVTAVLWIADNVYGEHSNIDYKSQLGYLTM